MYLALTSGLALGFTTGGDRVGLGLMPIGFTFSLAIALEQNMLNILVILESAMFYKLILTEMGIQTTI